MPGGCHRQTAALKWLLSHLTAAHLGGLLYSGKLSPVGMDRLPGQPWMTNAGEPRKVNTAVLTIPGQRRQVWCGGSQGRAVVSKAW